MAFIYAKYWRWLMRSCRRVSESMHGTFPENDRNISWIQYWQGTRHRFFRHERTWVETVDEAIAHEVREMSRDRRKK